MSMQFFCWREEHIRGFVTVKAAVRDIESAVGLRYVVRVAVSEKTRDAVNGRRGSFKFEKCADRCHIDFYFQAPNTLFQRPRSRVRTR